MLGMTGADTQMAVTNIQMMVGNIRMTVTNIQTIVKDTQRRLRTLKPWLRTWHRNMVTGQKGASGQNHLVGAPPSKAGY